MSRFTEPKGKVVRRFGINVFGNPKYDRLLAKRPNGPGVQGAGASRRKTSEYGMQLSEKQKIKFAYGLGERQFRGVYHRALRTKGITADLMLALLESRLDNVVYRLGMAPTRDAARQLVLHGHLLVNNRRVNVPSFSCRAGNVITVKDSPRSRSLVTRSLEESASRPVPTWLAVDKGQLRGEVLRIPLREDIPAIADVQQVVELYSK